MAMSKIERIEKEIQKTREKITEYQNKLRGLEAQKTEAENLQIVQLVRSMRLTPQELTAMLSGNGIPGIAPIPADYEEQEDNADEDKILASLTALCAALVLVGGFSVTAYAQTPTEETDDSGVIVETEPQPLTPEGNMTLVDDIDGDAAEDKQFIVVKSKGGNYFYIIVDRAAEGENSVHFLNQVDESDLMAIIGEEQTEQPPAVCNCTEKCKAGEVNTACPVCSAAMNNCTGKEAEPEAPAEPEKPKNSMGGLLIFLVVGLLGGGAALYYVKFMKPKQSVKGGTDLDEFDFDEYDEDEPEEEADSADTEQEDEEA